MTVAWFLAYLVLIFVGDSGRRSDGNLSIVPPASWETTAIVTVHHDGMLDDCDRRLESRKIARMRTTAALGSMRVDRMRMFRCTACWTNFFVRYATSGWRNGNAFPI